MYVASDRTDSVIVLNSNAYYTIREDKEACSTFVQLYQLYKTTVLKGDSKVQHLINEYEVIIQSKDSSHTSLLKQYDALYTLNTKSMQQTTATLSICRNNPDSLRTSLNILQQENSFLQKNIRSIKRQQAKKKWSFGFIGLAWGLVFGIVLMH